MISRSAARQIGVSSKRLLAAVGAALALSVPASAQVATARVAQGDLAGKPPGAVTAFLGVPFAAPPTGANRWTPPMPAAAWGGVRNADTHPASCQQDVSAAGFGPWTHEYVVSNTVSEDCLYLNIWTPAKAPGGKLPVLVWIHGGAFTSGSGSVPIYDGAALAAKGIIVVGINYRLGLYGFFAHPALTAESPAHASGNYGLLDQVAALTWVRDNIASFGGDASQVTIAGQSAGAAAVHHLIASPLAKGLFARAIAQSGSGLGFPVPEGAMIERAGVALQEAAGATDMAALRRLSPAELGAAMRKMGGGGPMGGGPGFGPAVDGLFLPDANYRDANTNDVPVLTGLTSDEMTGLNPAFGKMTAAALKSQIEKNYGPLAPRVMAHYPAANDAEANATVSHLARDRGLASTAMWAQRCLAGSNQPIYVYLWAHPEPGPDSARYRAFHSSEIPYVFGTLSASPERGFTDTDRRLSGTLGDYWVNWVKGGDPNGAGLPSWPRFTEADPRILEVGADTKVRPILPPETMALFEQYVRDGGQLGLF